ncbi:MAG: phenylacetate--CoA ligase family protein [Bacillota bacterium]|nr:MAG: phenylacetate--CoA ligase family protein [Bacillota bacterium]
MARAMTEERKYWNAEIEGMDPGELRRLESRKLADLAAYVEANSPFYRHKFGRVGVKAGDIRSLDDLERLPFTTKDELRETQEKDGGLGGHLCAPRNKVVRVQGTSGSTGRPLYVGLTAHDTEVWADLFARHAWIGGLRPGDSMINPANFTLFVGGLSEAVSAERMGITVTPVPLVSAGIAKLLQVITDLEPNILFATPSATWLLEDVIRSQLGCEPHELSFRKGFLAGEPLVDKDRAHIEETWGIDARNFYGLADVAADLASECEAKDGMHFVGQGCVVAELIDPDTGESREMTDGATGEIIYTTIDREATPVIRYRTRDVVRVRTEPCRCGRSSFRLHIIGRSDDMLKVKGVNVFPSAVKDVVSSFIPRTTGEMRIVLEQPGHIVGTNLRLKVEYGYDIKGEDRIAALRDELEQAIKQQLAFRPVIEMIPPGTLPRSTYKVEYFEHRFTQGR